VRNEQTPSETNLDKAAAQLLVLPETSREFGQTNRIPDERTHICDECTVRLDRLALLSEKSKIQSSFFKRIDCSFCKKKCENFSLVSISRRHTVRFLCLQKPLVRLPSDSRGREPSQPAIKSRLTLVLMLLFLLHYFRAISVHSVQHRHQSMEEQIHIRLVRPLRGAIEVPRGGANIVRALLWAMCHPEIIDVFQAATATQPRLAEALEPLPAHPLLVQT
jgi:hypothetical protein